VHGLKREAISDFGNPLLLACFGPDSTAEAAESTDSPGAKSGQWSHTAPLSRDSSLIEDTQN